MSEDPTPTSGGPLGHVDVPDEAPARAPHDMSEDPTYTSGGSPGNVNLPTAAHTMALQGMFVHPTIAGDGHIPVRSTRTAREGHPRQATASNGTSSAWMPRWAAGLMVIMVALWNWINSTLVSWPSAIPTWQRTRDALLRLFRFHTPTYLVPALDTKRRNKNGVGEPYIIVEIAGQKVAPLH